MAEQKTQAGLENVPSVSALGLRWAALRGMLASPLIEADEQRSLRDDLVRELQAIEQDFASLPARSLVEVAAKIDVVKTVLRQSPAEGHGWLANLLESVQADIRATGARPVPARSDRPAANLTRTFQARVEPAPAAPMPPSADSEPNAAA